MERLLLVLEAAAKADPNGMAARLVGSSAPDAYVVNRGEQAETMALTLARGLRAAGLTVELDGSGSAFGKQFKRADRCGARWALVLGDDEAARGEVRLKPLLGQGEEATWAVAEIAAIVEALRTL
jgi:histidyl-tRNA synthetase